MYIRIVFACITNLVCMHKHLLLWVNTKRKNVKWIDKVIQQELALAQTHSPTGDSDLDKYMNLASLNILASAYSAPETKGLI